MSPARQEPGTGTPKGWTGYTDSGAGGNEHRHPGLTRTKGTDTMADLTALPTADLLAGIRTAPLADVEAFRAEWERRRDRHPNRCAQHMDDAADTCPCYAAAFRIDAQVATGDYSAYRTETTFAPLPSEALDEALDDDDEAGWDPDAAYERWLETRWTDD